MININIILYLRKRLNHVYVYNIQPICTNINKDKTKKDKNRKQMQAIANYDTKVIWINASMKTFHSGCCQILSLILSELINFSSLWNHQKICSLPTIFQLWFLSSNWWENEWNVKFKICLNVQLIRQPAFTFSRKHHSNMWNMFKVNNKTPERCQWRTHSNEVKLFSSH